TFRTTTWRSCRSPARGARGASAQRHASDVDVAAQATVSHCAIAHRGVTHIGSDRGCSLAERMTRLWLDESPHFSSSVLVTCADGGLDGRGLSYQEEDVGLGTVGAGPGSPGSRWLPPPGTDASIRQQPDRRGCRRATQPAAGG